VSRCGKVIPHPSQSRAAPSATTSGHDPSTWWKLNPRLT